MKRFKRRIHNEHLRVTSDPMHEIGIHEAILPDDKIEKRSTKTSGDKKRKRFTFQRIHSDDPKHEFGIHETILPDDKIEKRSTKTSGDKKRKRFMFQRIRNDDPKHEFGIHETILPDDKIEKRSTATSGHKKRKRFMFQRIRNEHAPHLTIDDPMHEYGIHETVLPDDKMEKRSTETSGDKKRKRFTFQKILLLSADKIEERLIKRRRNEYAPPLPRDLIHEILLRLPVKCVLKFRCVSKLFAEISTEACFVSSHTERCKKKPVKSLIIRKTDAKSLIMFSRADNMTTLPLRKDIAELRMLLEASCDGLLCFSIENHDEEETHFVVGNPLTGDWTTLKLPVDELIVLGFYFHKSSNNYRLLLTQQFCKPHRKYWVLSLDGSQTLRPIESSASYYTLCELTNEPMIVHGKLHQLGFLRGGDRKKLIVVFDLETEQFSHIPIPSDDLKCIGNRPSLLEFEGELCIHDYLVNCPTVLVLEDYERQKWIRKQLVVEDKIDKRVEQSYIPISFTWRWGFLFAKTRQHGKKMTIFKSMQTIFPSGTTMGYFMKYYPATRRYTPTLATIAG